jgi:hypothetical protein
MRAVMHRQRWQFNNQPARERCWRNERGGDATTSQHKRGTARRVRQWRDKRGAAGQERGGVVQQGVARQGAARQKARQHDSTAQQWQGAARQKVKQHDSN